MYEGVDLYDYNHVIDSSAVNHIIKNHGNATTEGKRGQIAVEPQDFANITDAIYSPDKVVYGAKNNAKKDQVVYLKRLGDGTLLVINEQRVGKKELAVHTMRKYPATVDDHSVIRTLLPNAQSDGGNYISIIENPEPRNDILYSRQPQRPV